jgi:hypothetical protein
LNGFIDEDRNFLLWRQIQIFHQCPDATKELQCPLAKIVAIVFVISWKAQFSEFVSWQTYSSCAKQRKKRKQVRPPDACEICCCP